MNRLERRFPALLMARRNLERTRLRSTLAVLGIVIGVIAIASLGIFGLTLESAFLSGFGDVGNEIVVIPAQPEGVEYLSDDDVDAIEAAAGPGTAVPVKEDRSVLTHGTEETVVPAYAIASPSVVFTAREGTVPRELEDGVLVGATVADRLDVSAGSSLDVDGETYEVRGVLEEQGAFSMLNANAAIVVPPSAVDVDGYNQVVVRAESSRTTDEITTEIRDAVNDDERRASVVALSDLTDQVGSVFTALSAFLIGIGSISLVVAGVSILNVMLMSVVERRQEIGVMRAVGYRRADVLRIMLSEAALLGVAGGFVGVILSFGAGAVINWVMLGDPTAVVRPGTVFYLAAAFGFGLVTAVVSGVYPALKAANANPVETLRS